MATFCHCPSDRSVPPSNSLPGRASSPPGGVVDQVRGLAPLQGGRHGCMVVKVVEVADADRALERLLEAEVVLEPGREATAPLLHVEAPEIDPVDRDAPHRRLVADGEQLDQRCLGGPIGPDQGHHGAGGQVQVDVGQQENTTP